MLFSTPLLTSSLPPYFSSLFPSSPLCSNLNVVHVLGLSLFWDLMGKSTFKMKILWSTKKRIMRCKRIVTRPGRTLIMDCSLERHKVDNKVLLLFQCGPICGIPLFDHNMSLSLLSSSLKIDHCLLLPFILICMNGLGCHSHCLLFCQRFWKGGKGGKGVQVERRKKALI